MNARAAHRGRGPGRPAGDPPAGPSGGWAGASWSIGDRLGLAFAWLMGLLLCAICAAILVYLVVQGVRYLHPDLIWTNPKVGATQNETGGFLAPLLGTVIATLIAMLLATPIGVGVAVWLSEYARPRWLARVVESTVEMFAGAPSIVLALFGVILFQAPFLGFLSESSGGVVYGKSFFAAGAMLSLLALPLVVTSVREGLQAIPDHVREASYAVGKTKIATIRRVLLPAVRPDIVTGSMIGAGHAIGDTAIIVFLWGTRTCCRASGTCRCWERCAAPAARSRASSTTTPPPAISTSPTRRLRPR